MLHDDAFEYDGEITFGRDSESSACSGVSFVDDIDETKLQHASKEIRDDADVVQVAVGRNPWALRYASARLRSDALIVATAVGSSGETLQLASPELRSDKKIVLAAVMNFGLALRHASNALKNDYDVVVAAINNHAFALRSASVVLQEDLRVVMLAVTICGCVLKYVPAKLKSNATVVVAAITNDWRALKYAHSKLRGSVDIVSVAITQDGRALKFATAGCQNNEQVVARAAHQHGSSIQYASELLRGDKSMALIAMRCYSSHALRYVTPELQNNKEVVLESVRYNGLSLEHASAALRSDIDVVRVAVMSSGKALRFASPKLHFSKELALIAISNDTLSARYVGAEIMADPIIKQTLVLGLGQILTSMPMAYSSNVITCALIASQAAPPRSWTLQMDYAITITKLYTQCGISDRVAQDFEFWLDELVRFYRNHAAYLTIVRNENKPIVGNDYNKMHIQAYLGVKKPADVTLKQIKAAWSVLKYLRTPTHLRDPIMLECAA